MKLLFIAAEGAPFAKTGGLGDVIGALPKSLAKKGHTVSVILPYYDSVAAKFDSEMEDLLYFYTNVGWRRQYVGLKKKSSVMACRFTLLIISNIFTVVLSMASGMMESALLTSN